MDGLGNARNYCFWIVAGFIRTSLLLLFVYLNRIGLFLLVVVFDEMLLILFCAVAVGMDEDWTLNETAAIDFGSLLCSVTICFVALFDVKLFVWVVLF